MNKRKLVTENNILDVYPIELTLNILNRTNLKTFINFSLLSKGNYILMQKYCSGLINYTKNINQNLIQLLVDANVYNIEIIKEIYRLSKRFIDKKKIFNDLCSILIDNNKLIPNNHSFEYSELLIIKLSKLIDVFGIELINFFANSKLKKCSILCLYIIRYFHMKKENCNTFEELMQNSIGRHNYISDIVKSYINVKYFNKIETYTTIFMFLSPYEFEDILKELEKAWFEDAMYLKNQYKLFLLNYNEFIISVQDEEIKNAIVLEKENIKFYSNHKFLNNSNEIMGYNVIWYFLQKDIIFNYFFKIINSNDNKARPPTLALILRNCIMCDNDIRLHIEQRTLNFGHSEFINSLKTLPFEKNILNMSKLIRGLISSFYSIVNSYITYINGRMDYANIKNQILILENLFTILGKYYDDDIFFSAFINLFYFKFNMNKLVNLIPERDKLLDKKYTEIAEITLNINFHTKLVLSGYFNKVSDLVSKDIGQNRYLKSILILFRIKNSSSYKNYVINYVNIFIKLQKNINQYKHILVFNAPEYLIPLLNNIASYRNITKNCFQENYKKYLEYMQEEISSDFCNTQLLNPPTINYFYGKHLESFADNNLDFKYSDYLFIKNNLT